MGRVRKESQTKAENRREGKKLGKSEEQVREEKETKKIKEEEVTRRRVLSMICAPRSDVAR